MTVHVRKVLAKPLSMCRLCAISNYRKGSFAELSSNFGNGDRVAGEYTRTHAKFQEDAGEAIFARASVFHRVCQN